MLLIVYGKYRLLFKISIYGLRVLLTLLRRDVNIFTFFNLNLKIVMYYAVRILLHELKTSSTYLKHPVPT
jgi:hypothetical protein